MEYATNAPQNASIPRRNAAVTGLAIVGFIALVAAGIWLAVSSARFVPGVTNSIGAAAVYIGSMFTPAPAPSLSVVPTASTSMPFEEATSSAPASPVATPAPAPMPKAITPTKGAETANTYQISGNALAAPHGLPDLVTSIDAVGYLTGTTADSFVVATSVPSGMRPAVRFTIRNAGTNIAGAWRFSASIPTQTIYIYQSPSEQALNPGDSIQFTLGFDEASKGSGKTISITANFDYAIAESNTSNNSASATLTILGS